MITYILIALIYIVAILIILNRIIKRYKKKKFKNRLTQYFGQFIGITKPKTIIELTQGGEAVIDEWEDDVNEDDCVFKMKEEIV